MTIHDDDALSEVLESLSACDEAEVYHKSGRSRTMRYSPRSSSTAFHQEEGWAVRAGDVRRSFFYTSTGAPRPEAPWPEADGEGLRLPSAKLVPQWTPPVELDAPLISENEAQALFEKLERALDTELPGARLVIGELDDGSSESRLLSSREVSAKVRQRTAALYLEARLRGSRHRNVVVKMAQREARRFEPTALARGLADRLLIGAKGEAPPRDRGELLLAPGVVTDLLAALRDLWIGPGAVEAATRLVDRRGRIGSPALTLIDDGRLSGGLLESPVDGEGQPTRQIVLVEEGMFRQPLLAWWQATPSTGRPSGCALRPGWRDLPRPGPTHLYLRPDPSVGVASLLEGLSRGYYLLDTEGFARFEPSSNKFAVPVCGFAIESGRPTGSVSGAWLVGSVPGLLNGILAVARDLTFLPTRDGLLGAPTVHLKGLELRQRLDRPRR